MENIQFETDQTPRMNLSTEKEPSFAKLIIKLGITDDILTANYILIALAVLFFGITIFIYAGIFSKAVPSPLNNKEQQMMNGMPYSIN